ncbi:unnamed protein product [Withania somnifera]
MSPPYLHVHHHHHRSCSNPISPLKINKDSYYIKKSSSSLFNQEQQRHQPVIIYTHSPKIIHTHPRDFMALVQKLTGLSSNHSTSDPNTNHDQNEFNSDENNNSSCYAGVNSSSACCVPPGQAIFDPVNTNENEDTDSQNIQNDFGDSLDFLSSAHEPLCNYTDSLFFMSTVETSITSSFPDF